MRTLLLPISYQSMVESFMRAGGQQMYKTAQRRPTNTEINARHIFLMEEIEELKYAIKNNDRVEQLDAVCDILYIALGTAATFGFEVGSYVYTALKRIQMFPHKTDKDREEFEITRFLEIYDTIGTEDMGGVINVTLNLAEVLGFDAHVIQEGFIRVHESNMSKFCKDLSESEATKEKYRKEGIGTFERKNGSHFVVFREGDNKIMKSINYTPVDLTDLACQN